MILLVNTITYIVELLKWNPIDVRPDSYEEYNVDSNEKDPVFQVSRGLY